LQATGRSDLSKNIIKELHSFSVPNFGGSNSFLNSADKEFSFSLTVPRKAVPKMFRNHEINISFGYKFAERKHPFTYGGDDYDEFGKKGVKFNFGVFNTVKEQNGRGILVKYLISIDQSPFLEINRSEAFYDSGAYEGGSFTEAYSGEIKFFNTEILGSLKKRDSLKYFEKPSLEEIKVDFIEDTFISCIKLQKFIRETLSNHNVSFESEIDALLESCLKHLIGFQDYMKSIHFINLDRRENKRYIDPDRDSLFKTCIDYYFGNNAARVAGIHASLSRILPLFELPKNFKIDYQNDFGFQFMLHVDKDEYRNIADYGSGINQLLPLLLATSMRTHSPRSTLKKNGIVNNSLLIVEEPESNLHPAMQSKLADMFSILHKERNLDFVIETHSEYMVRRFQNLVAKGEVNTEDIIINYFWKDKGIHKCKQIEFREDGGLDDTFEKGFFDESLMLELDLLKLKNLN